MEMIPIPAFLDRRNPECKLYIGNKNTEVSNSHRKFVKDFSEVHKECRKLTANFKSKLAYEVIQYVRRGFDTFGKIKKVCDALPNFGTVSVRELKSAIRYAKTNRIPMPKVIGKGKKRQTIIVYRILSIKGRTYEVVDV
jgi:hypothetical protein